MALKPHSMLIDLRAADDFSRWHLPGAVSAPLASLAADTTPSPFADTGTLERQWCELEALFGGASSAITTAVVMPPSPTKTTMTTTAAAAATTAAKDLTAAALRGQRVVLLCYGGDTARVATSVLRAKGVDAFSVRGGVRALAHEWPDMLHAESDTSDANGLADAVDDDDDDDDDEELDEPASPTTDNGGAVNGDIRIGIHDDGDDFISTGVGIASGGDSDGHMAWPASVMLHDVDGKAPRHNSSGSGSSMNSGSMAAAAAAAVAHPLNAPSAFGAGGK
jgi:rhodanese-related sulfurtransferase